MHRFRDMTTYWSKIAEKKPNPPSFGAFLWGDPLRIFRWLIHRQKLVLWAIRWCTFHDPAFALLGTIPACDRRTDRRTDVRTRRCRKDPRQHSVARVKSWISRNYAYDHIFTYASAPASQRTSSSSTTTTTLYSPKLQQIWQICLQNRVHSQ